MKIRTGVWTWQYFLVLYFLNPPNFILYVMNYSIHFCFCLGSIFMSICSIILGIFQTHDLSTASPIHPGSIGPLHLFLDSRLVNPSKKNIKTLDIDIFHPDRWQGTPKQSRMYHGLHLIYFPPDYIFVWHLLCMICMLVGFCWFWP